MRFHIDVLKNVIDGLFEQYARGELIASAGSIDFYLSELRALRDLISEGQRSGDLAAPAPVPGAPGWEGSPTAWWLEVLRWGAFNLGDREPAAWPAPKITKRDFFGSYESFARRWEAPVVASSRLVMHIREHLPPSFGSGGRQTFYNPAKGERERARFWRLPSLRRCREYYLERTGLDPAYFREF
jgi:hypothetical protein